MAGEQRVSSGAPATVAEASGPRRHGLPGAATGPVTDWEDVYAANVAPIYRFVYSRTGNRPDAEDVTSQVFLHAMPSLRTARPEETRAYLFATARTQLANHWRDRYHVAAADLDEFAAPSAESAYSEAAGRSVECVLGRLPEHYRRVLELRFLRGFSVRETAAAMRTTAANTRVMQLRALRRAASLGFCSSLGPDGQSSRVQPSPSSP